MPYNQDRLIPDDLAQMATVLKGFRPPGEIHMILSRAAKRSHRSVTWTQRDIQNRYGMQHGNANFWQTEELLKVLATDGRPHEYSINEDLGILDHLIWLQHDGDMEVVLSAKECIIFDNTFNTTAFVTSSVSSVQLIALGIHGSWPAL